MNAPKKVIVIYNSFFILKFENIDLLLLQTRIDKSRYSISEVNFVKVTGMLVLLI